MRKSINYIIYFILGWCSMSTIAQEARNSELFLELQKLDKQLFTNGFNNCDMEAFKTLISDDFEFYHDKGGLENDKNAFITSFGNNMCDPKAKPIRKLQEQSLTVFPLYENGVLYGAIQKGIHEFYIQEPEKEMYTTSVARFTHVWVKENNHWKMHRALSYDHQSPQAAPTVSTHRVKENLLLDYAGTYTASSTGEVTISETKGTLYLKAGKMETHLVAVSDTLFKHPQAPLTFEFIKNTSGTVEKFLVRENQKIVEEVTRI